MDKRAASALWLVPLAYVILYRVLAQLATRILVAIDSAAYGTGLSFVIGIACALAAALICVEVHLRAVGALAPARAFVMAAIAIPMLMVGHLYSMGMDRFTTFLVGTPVNAVARYAIVFFALPLVAAAWRRTPVGEAVSAAAPPPSGGNVFLRIAVALLAVLGFVGWGVAFLFIYGMGGFGMGRRDEMVTATLASPLAVFVLCFLCAVGLFGPSMLRIARPVGAVLALPGLGFFAINGAIGLAAAAVFAAFLAMWWAMCRRMEARA